MRDFSPNEYERAFENWLIDNHVEYVSGREHKKTAFGHLKAKLAGLECWVTAGDVDGLARWQELLGPGHAAVFVFAYKIENIDVDFDGRDFYDYVGRRYIFFAVRLDDYRRCMVRRSPKWRTVTLPAEDFRRCAVQTQQLLL